MMMVINLLSRAKISNIELKTIPNKNKQEVLTLWDKIKDFFRAISGKKETIINILFQLTEAIKAIIPNDDATKMATPDNMIAMVNLGNDAIKLTELNNVFFLFKELQNAADDITQRQFLIDLISDEQGQASYYHFRIITSDVNKDPLLSFTVPTYWHELNKLTVDNKKFIENHKNIVIDYAQTHREAFHAQYPETTLEAEEKYISGEVLMQCSVFFLESNPNIKEVLLAASVHNDDGQNQLYDETTLDPKLSNNDQLRGDCQYTLGILYDALGYIERTKSAAAEPAPPA